ncbi:hypothetical protein MLD38_016631 [Melastoma candidum]|uniref:Uncharacterized protein n=1 Tax=Melastoma candidum TaxID=119954 RepID=A0ACB9QP79_9MYRT|nr:hypothetical protein MLD38_016631 [Melastoma candidum]
MGILGWEKQEGAGEGDYGHGEEEEDQDDCDVGLGLRMQPNHHNHDYNNTSSSSSSSSSCVFPNRKSMEVPLQYFAGDYLSGWSSSVAAYGGSTTITQFASPGLGCTTITATTTTTTDIHLLIVITHQSHCNTIPSASQINLKERCLLGMCERVGSGKMAASSSGDVRVPFTAAQWEEVERQDLILKHMMASSSASVSAAAAAASPVPPELLPTPIPMPTTKSFSNVASAAPYHPTRSGDPEPWRCWRTDGKKWRCSRDVAPHQKYCERHSHKNRPHSRKPVELTPASSTTTTDYLLDATKTTAVAASTAARRSFTLPPPQPPVDPRQAFFSQFSNPYDHNPPSGFPSAFPSSQPFNHPRCLDWLMKGESIPSSNPNQDWQHQNDASMASKSDAAAISRNYNSGGESFIDPFQQKQSSPYSTPQHSSLFLMAGVVDPIHSQQTRRFVDAWSNVDG